MKEVPNQSILEGNDYKMRARDVEHRFLLTGYGLSSKKVIGFIAFAATRRASRYVTSRNVCIQQGAPMFVVVQAAGTLSDTAPLTSVVR